MNPTSANQTWRSIANVKVKIYQCPSIQTTSNTSPIRMFPRSAQVRLGPRQLGATAGWEDFDHVANGSEKTTTTTGVMKGLRPAP